MASKRKPSLKKHSVAGLKRMKAEKDDAARELFNEARRIAGEIERRAFDKANVTDYIGKVYRDLGSYIIVGKPVKGAPRFRCVEITFTKEGDLYIQTGMTYSLAALGSKVRVKPVALRLKVRQHGQKTAALIKKLLGGKGGAG